MKNLLFYFLNTLTYLETVQEDHGVKRGSYEKD